MKAHWQPSRSLFQLFFWERSQVNTFSPPQRDRRVFALGKMRQSTVKEGEARQRQESGIYQEAE